MASHCIRLSSFDGAVVDLDGVVTDTASVHAATWAELFDGYLATAAPGTVPFDPDVDYLRSVDGKPRAEGVASFLASRQLTLPWGRAEDPPTADTVNGLGNRKDELFRRRIEHDGVRTFPGTIAFLQAVRAAGKPVAVVSASRNCGDVLAAANVTQLFDCVVDGVIAAEQGLPGKPDPATFLFAARLLGLAPERMVLVEDALVGVEAGRRGGFGLVVGVDRHHHAEQLRRAGAEIVVEDLAELTLLGPRDSDPAWTITREEAAGSRPERSDDAIFSLSDGRIGVRGVIEDGGTGRGWLTLVAGAFGTATDGIVRLLPGPSLTNLADEADEADQADNGPDAPMRRTLDLRTGVLVHHAAPGRVASSRFVSLARPGLVVVRAEETSHPRWNDRPLCPPELGASASLAAAFGYEEGRLAGGEWWAETTSDRSRVVVVAHQRVGGEDAGTSVERLAVVRVGARREEAAADLAAAAAVGFEALLTEHRLAWEQRWRTADIEIDGDDISQTAVRFALLHMLSCAAPTGESVVGARGLGGLAYSGHVFWDADVFVLPVLAATFPDAARTMLEYRVRRLGPARVAASASGHAGVRFPWESADTGDEVTPTSVRDHRGAIVAILTGSHEEHITADVAWAVRDYVEWTGDTTVLDGPGRDVTVETARYWASRIREDSAGRGHIDGVMGPDEYHEIVDDNAFTNILVRWHLRRATELIEATEPAVAARWRHLAAGLVDGYDPRTCRHEQFAGFWSLEPLRITEIATVPVAADVLLGQARVARAQVLKQPDVLMAHHLLPGEMPAGSLAADLDFYLPLTAHGSSLSPAVCASLLARAGRPDEALDLFDIAANLDLGDLSGTTGGGLHLATMGGLWQAVVRGFAGIRPDGDILRIDPHLPERWRRLQIRLRLRGVPLRIEITHDRVTVDADGPVRSDVYGVTLEGLGHVTLRDGTWRIQS